MDNLVKLPNRLPNFGVKTGELQGNSEIFLREGTLP